MNFLKKIKKRFGSPKVENVNLSEIKFSFLEKYSSNYESQKWYNWDELKECLNIDGYHPKKHSHIVISKDNYCVDGHHRIVILRDLKKYEIIEVKRLKYKYWFVVMVFIFHDILTLNFKPNKKWNKKKL